MPGEFERMLTDLVDRRIAAALAGAEEASGELVVSTTEAGRRLGVSRDTVVKWCELGELVYVEGEGFRGRMVTVESLRAFVARRQVSLASRRQRIARSA